MLSILIPTFNDDCTKLVKDLILQAQNISDLEWEIIVADDGSTNHRVTEANRAIDDMPNSIYLQRKENSGRAAIRNYLAQQARGNWLLFIDADMRVIDQNYLRRYRQASHEGLVVYGGYRAMKGPSPNLRYAYEHKAETEHQAARRQEHPWMDFHTSNFLIRRDVMRQYPLDERFRHYGYEDVFFGKQLFDGGLMIVHIDNPVGFCRYESNAHFLDKTEEGLRTLHAFRQELHDYSRLAQLAELPPIRFLRPLLTLHPWLHSLRRLLEREPSLLLFKVYKLGYYLSLK